MIRQGNWVLTDDDLIPTDPVCVTNDDWTPPFCRNGKFPQGLAIGIDRCKVACAARPKCKAIGIGHPTRGTGAECWLAGEINDQDYPLMAYGHWDFYDIEEVCEPGTQTPTMQPSSMPTVNPTSSPSVNPSSNPSFNPSSSPTSTPTTNPSKRPTAEDFIVKVKGFHGEPKDVLDASKLQDQPDVDAEFFGFEHKLTPFTRRLLSRFYDVGEQGFGREEPNDF